MTSMTVNVALSPVAIFTIASAVRIPLKGLIRALRNKAIILGDRSVANILGPCLSKAARTASSDNPPGLQLGSRLFLQLVQV